MAINYKIEKRSQAGVKGGGTPKYQAYSYFIDRWTDLTDLWVHGSCCGQVYSSALYLNGF